MTVIGFIRKRYCFYLYCYYYFYITSTTATISFTIDIAIATVISFNAIVPIVLEKCHYCAVGMEMIIPDILEILP